MYHVLTDDGAELVCHVKGNFRIRGIRSTNPVAVGDRVDVQQLTDGTNWITDISDRKNYIIRRATNLSKQSHIIAANLDLVCLVVTLRHPQTSLTFIDRFLATAQAYQVPVCIVFNKVDLLSEDEQAELHQISHLYASLGYQTLAISATNLDTSVFDFLKGKITLFSGNSGVGKSTLLNALLGKQVARTAAISSVHDKGMHTTTFSEMYPLCEEQKRSNQELSSVASSKGWIIDTPGIKGFGTFDMDKYEVGHYFREIFSLSKDCRFSNCTHTGETGCAVLPAVENGTIAASRFNSYLSLLGDIEESKYR